MSAFDLLEERPKLSGQPPVLPPFLRKRGGPERRVVILPDITRIEGATHLRDYENNWITIVYEWMNRVTTSDSILSPNSRWETAHTSMRRYRQWLEIYEAKDGLPPHIQFGGAIEAGEGDPTFYSRWQAYAREMFV